MNQAKPTPEHIIDQQCPIEGRRKIKSVFDLVIVLAVAIFLSASCSPSGTASGQPIFSPQATLTTPVQASTLPVSPQPHSTSITPYVPKTPISQNGELQVHFIDVGQGDSVLILAPDGKTMLIDGGEAESGVLQYLKSKGINRLDLVVATHPHADHIGGLVQIMKTIPTAKVVTNGQPTTTKTYENFLDAIAAAKAQYAEVKRSDSVALGSLNLAVLNPTTTTGDLNNNSIVLRLAYGKVSFLFTGDAQAEAEASMSVSSFSPVQATILKVAHHGSHSSSTPAFLNLVQPEVAVYSAGKGNSYGHPHTETIAALLAVGAQIYGTDVNGTVVVTTDGVTYQVSPVTGQPRGPPVVQQVFPSDG